MAECIRCEEEYSDRRYELGYLTCLDCGATDAQRIISTRSAENLRAMTPNASAGSVEKVFEES
jgi:predicted  nucleic acid-binding Zn-ribbon protein